MKATRLLVSGRILRPVVAMGAVVLIVLVISLAASVSSAFAQGQGYLLPGTVPVCATPGDNCVTRTDPVLVSLVEFDAEWVQVWKDGVMAGYVRKSDVPDAFRTVVPTAIIPAQSADTTAGVAPVLNAPKAIQLNLNMGLVWENYKTMWSRGFWHGLIMQLLIIAMFMLPYIENRIEKRAEVNVRFVVLLVYVFVIAWIEYVIGMGGGGRVLTWIAGLIGSWFYDGAIWVVAVIGVLGFVWQYNTIWLLSGQITDIDSGHEPETKHFKDTVTRDEWVKTDMRNEEYRLVKVGYTKGKDEPAWAIVEKIREVAREDGTYSYAALFAPWVALQLFGIFVFAVKTSYMSPDFWDLLLIIPLIVAGREVWNEFGKSWSYILSTTLYGLVIGGLIILLKVAAGYIPAGNWLSNIRDLPVEFAVIAVPLLIVLTKAKNRFSEGTIDLAGFLTLVIIVVMQVASLFGPAVARFIYGGG